MLKTMRNPKAAESRRDWAAAQAAPYIHPKLATLQSNVNLTGRLTLEDLVSETMKLHHERAANENVENLALPAPSEDAANK